MQPESRLRMECEMTEPLTFQPVIIIGAARSGTNMLRDMLTNIDGVGTWPCDEINYIWRYGNALAPHDQLTAEHAKTRTVKYIRRSFLSMAERTGSRILIEKTCANSLRVEFVNRVVPEAKYILVVRDGRDVVLSAMKRWTAPLELSYLLKKVPFVPWRDLPQYAASYLWHRIYRQFSSDKRLRTWGPRFVGMQELAARLPLDELCAHQWRQSIELATQALSSIPTHRVHVLRYEEIATNPGKSLDGVLQFLNVNISNTLRQHIIGTIRTDSVAGWKHKMSVEQLGRISRIIGGTLSDLGYDSGCQETCKPAA